MAHKKKHYRIKHKKSEKEDIKKSFKKTKRKFDLDIWKITSIALIVLIVASLTFIFIKKSTSPTGKVCMFDHVKLDFYVMSQCPYGTQVENAIKPVLDKLGNCIDFNLNYIASENTDGSFRSLHGEPEVNGDIVQLCAAKYNPDKYMDMIVCQNKNARGIPDNWEDCAKDNDLDVNKIKACYEGDEGKNLLSESIKKSDAVKASGSPTIYLNDIKYSGGRGTNDFLRAICNSFEDKPEACSKIPEPAKVNLVVISDKRCTECNSAGLIGQLKGLFPGLQVTEYDYNDEEGNSLYESTGVQYLPAFLFDKTVEEGEGYDTIKGYLVKAGDYQSLRVGASFDPKAEICTNDIDDNGDGLIDCEDPTCSGELKCMEKLDKPKVELFVMSYCPYGTQMEKGLIPVIDLLGDKAEWDIDFVYYAMHGEKEVTEQLLQYCIQEERGDVYLDYLACFLKEGDTDTCLTENGLTRDEFKTCVDETDAEFEITSNLEDKSKWLNGRYPLFNIFKDLNDKYNVGGSPTFVINGVKVDGQGRDPASILETVCLGFKNPPTECSQTLSSKAYQPGFGFEFQASSGSVGGGCGV